MQIGLDIGMSTLMSASIVRSICRLF